MDTPGFESTITANVTGMISREAYFTEDRKTVWVVSGSFCALIFENVGNRTVVTGITNNDTRAAKLIAT